VFVFGLGNHRHAAATMALGGKMMMTRQFFGTIIGHSAAYCLVMCAIRHVALRRIALRHVIAIRPLRIVS
jgi:hypothetical protein